ncbi:hypothetical protein ACFVYD_02130, partial [Streptomyces sp. NPDC058301]|uniref:hypothetical protein n=1 Tax=Streptomyces sp. NPDC058301 TaxID=3346436 RepID=UPI0036E9A308
MNDRRPEGPGDGGEPTPEPIPRDLPDQQAGAADDPWEAGGDAARTTPGERPDPSGPDTGEADETDADPHRGA